MYWGQDQPHYSNHVWHNNNTMYGNYGNNSLYGGSSFSQPGNYSRNQTWPRFGLVLHNDEHNVTWRVMKSEERAKIICEIELEAMQNWHMRKWNMSNDKIQKTHEYMATYDYKWNYGTKQQITEKLYYWEMWWKAFESANHQKMLELMREYGTLS